MRNPLALLLLISTATASTVVGTVRVKGSDTIGGALGPALAAAYEAGHPGSRVVWEGLGSGTAFVGLLDGSADIGASSRSVRPSELDDASRAGVTLREFVLCYDGIAVVVHPSNPIRSLTIAQLRDVFSGRVRNWRALGWRDTPITTYSRPSYSGTQAFFKERVLAAGGASDADFAAGTRVFEHNDEIVIEVARDPTAIAYLGMGWRAPGTRTVAISGDEGAAAELPSADSVRRGTYPLYRPLLLYTRGEPVGDVRRFLAYVLLGEGRDLISQFGFIPTDVQPPVLRLPDESRGEAAAFVLRVWFPAGGVRLDAAARGTLAAVAARVAETGERLEIVGHGDTMGSAGATTAVAEARARVVADYLVSLGIARDQISAEGRGSEQPIATNETPDGRRQNRRADVRFLPVQR